MVCSGCKQLGHLVGACPSVKRVWVQKGEKHNDSVSANNETLPAEVVVPVTSKEGSGHVIVEKPHVVVKDPSGNCSNAADGWTTVNRKPNSSKPCPEQSNPSEPVLGSPEVPIFKALAKTMTKNQLKRARRAGGKDSPKKK